MTVVPSKRFKTDWRILRAHNDRATGIRADRHHVAHFSCPDVLYAIFSVGPMGTARDGNNALAVRTVLQERQVKKRKRRSIAVSRAAARKGWRTRHKMKEVRIDDGKWHHVVTHGDKTFVDGKLAKPIWDRNVRMDNWPEPNWWRASKEPPHIDKSADNMLPIEKTINRVPKVEWL